MQKDIKHLLLNNFFVIALLITFIIAYLSLMSMPKSNSGFHSVDKLYHIFAYFVLSICWLISFSKNKKAKNIVLFGCIIYGTVIEILQNTLTTHRTGDYKDVLANTFGILLGLMIFNLFFKKISVN